MTFFQDLPVPPERPRPPRHVMPVWVGPPANELPVVIHVGNILHRTPGLVMAVKSVEVFMPEQPIVLDGDRMAEAVRDVQATDALAARP
jgi:hypothetical protein